MQTGSEWGSSPALECCVLENETQTKESPSARQKGTSKARINVGSQARSYTLTGLKAH